MPIDAFDAIFDKPQTAPPPQARATEYAVIQPGRAEVEIVAATVGDVPWRISETNPSGQCLQLRLSAGRGFSFIFADLPRDRTYVLKALAAALGITPDADGGVTLPLPHEMVGRTVTVEVAHYQTKRGETKATVKRWLPANRISMTPRSPTATPRVAATRRATEQLPDDGVPF